MRSRRALSLLEVILALSILGVACTFMAQAMRLATDNAMAAQRQAQAELAAESVLSQVVAGIIPMQPSAAWVPVGTSSSTSSWSYMIGQVNCEVENMVGLQIMVKDMSNQDTTTPADFSVIRWVIDPALGLDSPPTTDTTGQSGQSGSSGSATGTGSGTSAGGLNGKM